MNSGYMRALFMVIMIVWMGSLVQCTGKPPVPFCKSQLIFYQFPMIPNQILSADMSSTFSGYNLDIQLASNNSFAKLNKKLTQLDHRQVYLPGLIAHHVQHEGNGWGKEMFILSKTRDVTSLTYGHFESSHQVPKVNTTVMISADKDVNCFDAVFYYSYAVAIVDCVYQNSSTESSILKNYFYYVDLTKPEVMKKVFNPMFVNFRSITKRKTLEYRNLETGGQYFLRAYQASGVDFDSSLNTYMQIWLATDPHDLQLHSVIDRTFLHVTALQIADVKIYLGDIFMLDSKLGLYRMDIQKNQQVAITGRYDKQGFTKFSVYSDDLENEVLLALANNHSIYEVEWRNSNNPVLVNKYSLMEQSKVHQLIINNRYVIVQSTSVADNETHKSFEVDYTWVFTKGSRTYSHAHLVIDHNSSMVEIQFNKEDDRLLIADEAGIRLYQLDEARLQLQQGNQSKIGESEDVVITASSWDYHTNKTQTCQQKFTVYFVKADNFSIWQTGIQPPKNYSFNFPGEMHFPLSPYAIGPLLNYSIVNTKSEQVPTYWVNKVNRTRFVIDRPPHPGDVTFFYTELIPELGDQLLIYYYEENNNVTHVAECRHIWESTRVNCEVVASHAHNSHLLHFSSAFFFDEEGWNYFYVMVLQANPKSLFIVDFERHQRVAEISFSGEYQGAIGCLASSNGYLYVLLPYIKTINVYKLSKCQEDHKCPLEFQISAQALKPLGIDYFAPQQLITNRAHPQVLFIKCLGELVILDIDNKQRITVLDEITSAATKDKFYKVAVNDNRMVLVAQPNIIEEYDLRLIYSKKEVKLLKNLPTYGFTFPPNADIEFSDMSHIVYINAYDPSTDKTVILIYKLGGAAVNSLMQEIQLDKKYSRPGLEIEVSGFTVDFLSIIAGNQFMVYRIFQHPSLSIKDAFFDFTFDIIYTNQVMVKKSSDISVSITNYPTGFTPTKLFNTTMSNFKVQSHGNYSWDDRKWFEGHVIDYNYTCDECQEKPDKERKVWIREHVDRQTQLHLGGNDYVETFSGGISIWNDLFRWNVNGTVHSVHNLPDQKLLEYCVKVAATYSDLFAVTACLQLGRGANLYVTSLVSFKGFTWGPFRCPAYYVRNLQICQDILMVVDSFPSPEHKLQEGAVYLYQLSFDKTTGEQMDQLEIIDSNDFYGAHGWEGDKAYIGNADLIYSSNTQAFRLYVTQVDNGFFVIDFTKKARDTEINILSTEFVDMKALLLKTGFHLPNGASFQSIVHTGVKYNPHLDTENVVVTTKGYHNFEITLAWDDTGHLVAPFIEKVYYRYGYYNSYNDVKAIPGYLAMGYILPPIYQILTNFTRQIIAVYDTRDYDGQSEKGYAERYIMGAYKLNHTAPAMFAFNTTYDHTSNGSRIGIVVTEPSSNVMNHASVSRLLTVEFKKDFKDQILTIIPYSDFARFSFNVTLVNPENEDVTEEILIIVIVVLCVLITIFFTLYVIVLVRRKKRQNEKDGKRQSLLTEEESVLNRESVEARTVLIKEVQRQDKQQEDDQDEKDQEDDQEDDQGADQSQQNRPLANKPQQNKPESDEQQLNNKKELNPGSLSQGQKAPRDTKEIPRLQDEPPKDEEPEMVPQQQRRVQSAQQVNKDKSQSESQPKLQESQSESQQPQQS